MKKLSVMALFKTYLVEIMGFISLPRLFIESEHNNATGIRTHLPQCHSPELEPLRHEYSFLKFL